MDIQYIKAAGIEYAVLLRANLDALLEEATDKQDIAAAELVQKREAKGEEEFLSAAFVERILSGEQPLKVWREHRQLTVAALAKTVGISAAYLSEIESGKKECSISTLQMLAVVLRVGLDDIVANC